MCCGKALGENGSETKHINSKIFNVILNMVTLRSLICLLGWRYFISLYINGFVVLVYESIASSFYIVEYTLVL